MATTGKYENVESVISLHMTFKSTNNKYATELKVLYSMQILIEEVV